MRSSRLPEGTILGSYALVRPIASGAMGTVFEARHVALGRRAAVKVLHSLPEDAALAREAIARFEREGRAAVAVRHPHVVDVFDFGIDDGCPFLAMELVDGESLAQRLAREGSLPLDEVVGLLLPILSAVAELHAAGITHRDLKPANILLARGADAAPKVADFGVSRIDDGFPSSTPSGSFVGTPGYLAPELVRAATRASELSDQYALGVVLYECATGRKPFHGISVEEILQATVNVDACAPSRIVPSLSPAFDAVVLRAMDRDPARRFLSVDDLAQALLPMASERIAARWRDEFTLSLAESVADTVRQAARRRRARAALLALAGAMALSIPAVLIAHSNAGAERERAGLAAPPTESTRPKLAALDTSVGEPPAAATSAVPEAAPAVPDASVRASPSARLPRASVHGPPRGSARLPAALSARAASPPPAPLSLGANRAPILEVP